MIVFYVILNVLLFQINKFSQFDFFQNLLPKTNFGRPLYNSYLVFHVKYFTITMQECMFPFYTCLKSLISSNSVNSRFFHATLLFENQSRVLFSCILVIHLRILYYYKANATKQLQQLKLSMSSMEDLKK